MLCYEEEDKDNHLTSMTKLDPLAINNCTAITDCTSTNDNNTSSESGISVGQTTSSDVYAKGSKKTYSSSRS